MVRGTASLVDLAVEGLGSMPKRATWTVSIVEPSGGRGWSVIARWGAKKRRYGKRAGVRDEASAWGAKLAIEDGFRRGYWWEPEPRREARLSSVPSIELMMNTYLEVRALRGARDGTIRALMSALNKFSVWLIAASGREDAEALQVIYEDHGEDALFAYAGWAGRSKDDGGGGLTPGSVLQYGTRARQFWEWAARRWRSVVPPAPEFSMDVPKEEVVAPTWAQMDQLVTTAWAVSPYWVGRLYTIARFTGLRSGQIARLRWDDFNFDAATLRVRPELGKSRQERAGRTVPVSRHLLQEMSGWGLREGLFITTKVTHAVLHRCCRKAGLPKELWENRPAHLMRRGFLTGLVLLGADVWAVERLLGHAVASGESAVAAAYLDRDQLVERMRPAVDLVPPIGGGKSDISAARKARGSV